MPDGTPSEPQRVSAAEILESGAPASDPSRAIDVTRLTATQKTGLWIAAGAGALMLIVLLLAFYDLRASAPPPPVLPANATPAAQARIIANYKALSDAARAGPMELIDRVVVKALLPIVTLAVGYVLGHESRKSG